MKTFTRLASLALITAAGVLPSCTEPSDAAPPGDGSSTEVVVQAVIDGDTIRADVHGTRERIRIIGVNTPEIGRDGAPSDCYAGEAREALDALVYRQTVVLRSDPSQADRDQYGRLLRHVSVAGEEVALKLLEDGYGREYTFRKPYDGQDRYRDAETVAQKSGRGLWGAC